MPAARPEARSTDAAPDSWVGRQAYLVYYALHLEELPAAQRRALSLVETQGASYDDVATCMGTSREDVRRLVFEGRQQIRGAIRGSMDRVAAAAS